MGVTARSRGWVCRGSKLAVGWAEGLGSRGVPGAGVSQAPGPGPAPAPAPEPGPEPGFAGADGSPGLREPPGATRASARPDAAGAGRSASGSSFLPQEPPGPGDQLALR